ncbi:MAG: hypothetical protein ACRDHU_16005, partial [Actinomycetota bacterium]
NMRARRLLPLLIVGAILAPAPAYAGGSWLEPDRRAYVPGDAATFRGSFSLSGSLEGRIADGPYVAYLLEAGRWLRPGGIPAGAIRLGELRIVRSNGPHPTRAVVSFEVPDVPTGWYHLGYCNQPCTVDGIGDLVGGDRFVVAPTRAEGLAIVRVDGLAGRVAAVRHRVVARTRQERTRLEQALEGRTRQLQAAQTEVVALRTALRETGPVIEPLVPSGPSVTWWIALLAGLAGLGAGLALGRRRSDPMFVVPDTVPDDLEDRTPVPLR